jgi:hypothetical protein
MGHIICVGVLDAEWGDQRGAVAYGVARTDSVLSEEAKAQPKYSPVEQVACPEFVLSKVEGRSRRVGVADDAMGGSQGCTQRRERRCGLSYAESPQQHFTAEGLVEPLDVEKLLCDGRYWIWGY